MSVREGDVFEIPLEGDRMALGQVAARLGPGKMPCFLVVFGGFDEGRAADPQSLAKREIVLQAISFDVLIKLGRWPLVGHAPPVTDQIEWPEFKTMTNSPSTWVVIDLQGAFVRDATRADLRDLPHHTSVAPIRIEKAARALAGLERWDESYDILLPPSKRTRPVRSPEDIIARLRDQ